MSLWINVHVVRFESICLGRQCKAYEEGQFVPGITNNLFINT